VQREINVLVGIVEKWIVMFDDGEYEIGSFEKLKTQGWKYSLWRGLCRNRA
jgi:hypothetical protein